MVQYTTLVYSEGSWALTRCRFDAYKHEMHASKSRRRIAVLCYLWRKKLPPTRETNWIQGFETANS